MRKCIGITSRRLLAVTLSIALTLSGSYAVKADSNTKVVRDETVAETTADFDADEAIEEDSTALADNKDAKTEADKDSSALETDKESTEENDISEADKKSDEVSSELESVKENEEETEALENEKGSDESDAELEADKESDDSSAAFEDEEASEDEDESDTLESDKEIVDDIDTMAADEVVSESANPSGLSDEDEEARNSDMNPGLFGTPKIETYLNTYCEGWGESESVEIIKNDSNSAITENMVNFNLLGTTKATTLVIDGVDEIRKICFPKTMKNLIIKNTTLNLRDDCGFFTNYDGGFKNANLETLILENVTIGNRFEYDFSGSEDIYSRWSYVKNNRIDISNCEDLKELKLDVNFLSDQSVLAFDAGSEYEFDGLKASKKCTINNNSSIGRLFVVSKNPDSYFCKNGYSIADAVEFEDQYFEKFLFNQGFDTNDDGILTQGELDEVKDLTCNINTIGSVIIDIIQSYKDIENLTNLENLTIELGRNRNAARINDIAFPDSGHLKNITIMNTHTTISSMTVPSVENFTYTNNYGIEINQSVTKPELVINDTLGKLTTLNISYSDVTGVTITNNANKRNLSIRASHCEDLGKIEFLGNGYTLFGDVDIDYCTALYGIGTKTTTDGVTKWQADCAFDGNVTYINADYCKRLCGDELIINYDFAEGRTLNINAYELGASNEKNKLTILGRTAGNVKFFCGESDSWIKAQYDGQDGFTIKAESSTPNILEFPFGNHIRDNAGSGSNTPEQWVDRYDIVLRSGSYGPHMDTAKQDTVNNFIQNIKFYVTEDGSKRRITNIGPDLGITNNGNNQTITFTLNGEKGIIRSESRYTGDGKIYTMYFVGNDNIEFDSTGTLRAKKPGNVNVKAYLGKEVADDKYIGEVNICVRNLAKDVELTNNNPAAGEGTEESNPVYVARDEGKLTFSATFKYDGDNIPNGYDEVYWVFGDQRDGVYSDMAAQFATEAGITMTSNTWTGNNINQVADDAWKADSPTQVDENTWRGPTNTRSYTFSKNGKFMFGAIIPCNKTENASNGTIIRKDRYIEVVDPATVEGLEDTDTITYGSSDNESVTITITGSKSDCVEVKNVGDDNIKKCFLISKETIGDKSVWKVAFNPNTSRKIIKKYIQSHNSVTVVVTANSVISEKEYELIAEDADLKDVNDPEFSIVSGTELRKGDKVKLSCDTAGASIYYTLDYTPEDTSDDVLPDTENVYSNENPDGTTYLYEDMILINEDVTIKAIAARDDCFDSNVVSASYTIKDETSDWGEVDEEDQSSYNSDANTVPKNLWLTGVSDQDYSGKPITFENLRVYKNRKLLSLNRDYTVKYSNNINAGYATVTVTGKGYYEGSVSKSFKIKQRDISSANASDILLGWNNKVQKGTTPVTYSLGGTTVTLKANKDYTFAYPKTNSKEADYDSTAFKNVGEYEIQIVGKGNYTGSLTITETITSIPLLSKMTVKKVVNKPYSGVPIEQEALEVWNGKAQLSSDDYTVSYENNTDIGTASVIIIAKDSSSSCIGSKIVTFNITGDNLNKAAFGKEVTASFTYTGSDIMPVNPGLLNDPENSNNSVTFVRNKVKTLLYGIEKSDYNTLVAEADSSRRYYDYTYEYVGDTKNIGVVKVVFEGINGYFGTVTKSYKIVVDTNTESENYGVDVSKMKVSFDGDVTYDGTAKTPVVRVYQTATRSTPEKEFTLNTDYEVSYENNVNAGKKATIIIKGINKCTGTIKKTFTIKQKPISEYMPEVTSSVVYCKNGVKPEVTVKDGEKTLVLGTDYTVGYSNNKDVNDGSNSRRLPTVTVTGKGNYTGKVLKNFVIVHSSLGNVSMTAADVSYARKAGVCKPALTLTDSDGGKLAAGKDYEIVNYKYAMAVYVEQLVSKNNYTKVYRSIDDEVDLKNDIIPKGTDIIVTVKGKGSYTDTSEKSAAFRITGASIAGAKVSIPAQIYLGSPVELRRSDISVVVNKTTLKNSDYEIVGYSNNNQPGSATVTIHGIGNYGGTKTVKFAIKAKSLNYTVVYDNNDGWMSENKAAPASTGRMNNSSTPSGAKLTANVYKRPAYVFAGWNTKPDGNGQSFANKDAFCIEDIEFGKTVTLYAMWTPITYMITYNGAVVGKNGVTSNDNPATYTFEDDTITLAEPERPGYTFKGWYLDSKFRNVTESIDTKCYGNKTIYAKWSID